MAKGAEGPASGSETSGTALRDAVLHFIALCIVGAIVHLSLKLMPAIVDQLDRSVIDGIVRYELPGTLNEAFRTGYSPQRFVFVDVDQKTCDAWAQSHHTQCTLSVTTARDNLAELLNAIATNGSPEVITGKEIGPRLVVIDIDLAPLPRAKPFELVDNDAKLCNQIVELAAKLPVLMARPMVIDHVGASAQLVGFGSVADMAFQDGSCGSSQRAGEARDNSRVRQLAAARRNIWFGSPVISADLDGVTRGVDAWGRIAIRDELAGVPGETLIGSIGLVGGAILRSLREGSLLDDLASSFPASRREVLQPDQSVADDTCDESKREPKIPRWVSRRLPEVARSLCNRFGSENTSGAKPRATVRIRFSMPSYPPGSDRHYPDAPAMISKIPAMDVVATLHDVHELFANAVVIIGGSHLASGDLHVTPLDNDEPGAMVHANAIRAFLDALNDGSKQLIVENDPLVLTMGTIVGASSLGALSHWLQRRSARDRGKIAKISLQIAIALPFVMIQVVLSFVILREYASEYLSTSGIAVATIAPVIAIAFEGLTHIIHDLVELVAGLLSLARFGKTHQRVS